MGRSSALLLGDLFAKSRYELEQVSHQAIVCNLYAITLASVLMPRIRETAENTLYHELSIASWILEQQLGDTVHVVVTRLRAQANPVLQNISKMIICASCKTDAVQVTSHHKGGL